MKRTHSLSVIYHTPGALTPHPNNARRHSRAQIRKITDSIRSFGFNCPVLIDEQNRILAGHARLEAAKQLGLDRIPTIRIDQLSERQKRAFLIADNRLTEIGEWNEHALAIELKELTTEDLDFEISALGFETAEIDILIDSLTSEEKPRENDELDLPLPTDPVSRPGDLWRLGSHRLLCGNALETSSYERLMENEIARMVFTDSPYNVRVDGHVCGLGRIKHDEFTMASGEMSEEEFTTFLSTAFNNLARFSCDGSLHFTCIDWRHVFELLTAAREVYTEIKNLCVWAKTNAGMGSLYRSQHELVFVFKHGTAPHVNNVELGKHGRYRSNIWTYPGVNALGKDRTETLQLHPTVKPVTMVADAIKDCTKQNDIVLDAFVGSGTTILAAEQTGRRAYAIELEPRYVDTAIRRWQKESGKMAVHDETYQPFAEIEEKSDES